MSPISHTISAGSSTLDHTKLGNSRNVETQQAMNPGSGLWVPVGPLGTDYGSGEMRAVAVNSTDANTLYVGAAEGGVWKTTNGGSAWIPLTDTQLVRSLPSGQQRGTLSIGAITIDSFPRPNVIYVGTGDLTPACCAGRFSGPALGAFKSSDGGTSWTPLGVSLTNPACANTDMSNTVVNKIVVRDGSPITVFAASVAGIFEYPEDGSDCWRRIGGGLPTTGDAALDLVMDRLSGTLYAAFEHQGIWKSTDTLGQRWMQLTSILPPQGSFGRIFLAFRSYGSGDLASKALYAGFNYAGTLRLFRFSFDASNDWTELPTPPQDPQLEFAVAMALGPHSPSSVYIGLRALFLSTNGGASGAWSDISCMPPASVPPYDPFDCVLPSHYVMHADFHDIVFAPLGSFTQTSSVYEIFFLAEDGGIMKGIVDNTGTITWASLTKGLQVGQCGTMTLSPNDANLVGCGLWHNGNFLLETGISPSFGTLAPVGGGDGYQISIDAATGGTTVYYNCNAGYGGAICRAATPPHLLSVGPEEPICDSGGGTAAPGRGIYSDPYRPGNLLTIQGQGLLVRTTTANTSPASLLNSACPNFQPPWQVINPAGTYVTVMAFRSPLLDGPCQPACSSPVYYIGTTNGQIWRGSPEVGWSKLCDCSSSEVVGIGPDFLNPNERLYAVFSGSSSPGRIKELTRLPGNVWSVDTIDSAFFPDLQVNILTSVAVEPPILPPGTEATTVFVGTDQGIYYGQPSTSGWVWAHSPGMPNVVVTEIQVHQSLLYYDRAGVIRAGTYGRGVFELAQPPDIVPPVPIFKMDWADYDNDGRITIIDIAHIAINYGRPNDYWDLSLHATINILDVAQAAFLFGQGFNQDPYPSKGLPQGTMDPGWAGICRLMPAPNSGDTTGAYCTAHFFHNLFFPTCGPLNNQLSCISRYSVGGNCFIGFHVKNAFSFRTDETGPSVAIAASGTSSTTVQVNSLSPGQEYVAVIPDPTSCGQGLVTIKLDYQDVITESNEGDNSISFSLVS